MAQFATHKIMYSDLVQATTVAARTFLLSLNRLPEFGAEAKQEGTAKVRIVTAASLTTVTDGTMATNAAANTHASVTYASGQYTASLLPHEYAQYGPQEQAADYEAAVNAQILAIETAVLTAYMAGTPGGTAALPTGQANFTNDGTDAEIRQNLRILDTGWSHVLSRTGGDPSQLFIVCNYMSYAGIIAGRESGLLAYGDTGMPMWRGQTPIYVSRATSTGWKYPGVANMAGGTAAIIGHRDSGVAAFGQPYLHGGGPIAASDGTTKYIWICPYGTALVQNTWYEITNTSS